MPRLSGKTALVTGAARGIGAAIAQAFADEGAQVIVTDIDVDGGLLTAGSIGGRFVRLDVACEADWARIASQFPKMDVVVNNAGITGFEGPFEGPRQPMIQKMPNLLIGTRSMRSTWMAPFWAAVMQSAPCEQMVRGRLSTFPHAQGLSEFQWQRPTPHPRPPSATTPRAWPYIAPVRA